MFNKHLGPVRKHFLKNKCYTWKPITVWVCFLCCLMTTGLSKDIWCHVWPDYSMLAIHQARHHATSKLDCQPGDCRWTLKSSWESYELINHEMEFPIGTLRVIWAHQSSDGVSDWHTESHMSSSIMRWSFRLAHWESYELINHQMEFPIGTLRVIWAHQSSDGVSDWHTESHMSSSIIRWSFRLAHWESYELINHEMEFPIGTLRVIWAHQSSDGVSDWHTESHMGSSIIRWSFRLAHWESYELINHQMEFPIGALRVIWAHQSSDRFNISQFNSFTKQIINKSAENDAGLERFDLIQNGTCRCLWNLSRPENWL